MMDSKLPFVWRTAGRAVTDTDRLKIKALLTEFMLTDDHVGFQRYERHKTSGDPSSILILLPGESFYRGNQTYRSDVKWMWKILSRNHSRIEIGSSGFLFLFVTDELKYYDPGPDVIKGSFEDAELLWSWIKYVTSKSWFKQKKGQLRGMFGTDYQVPDMLKKVSERLISGDP